MEDPFSPPYMVDPNAREYDGYVAISTRTRPRYTACIVYFQRTADPATCRAHFLGALDRARRICDTLNDEGYFPLLR